MFIQRQYERTEHDDFVLNVQHQLIADHRKVAEPAYHEETLVGWNVIDMYD